MQIKETLLVGRYELLESFQILTLMQYTEMQEYEFKTDTIDLSGCQTTAAVLGLLL